MNKKIKSELLIGVLENAYFKSAEDDQEVLKMLIDSLKKTKQEKDRKEIYIQLGKLDDFSISVSENKNFKIELNPKGFYEAKVKINQGEDEIDAIIHFLNSLTFDAYESQNFVLNLIENLKEELSEPQQLEKIRKDGCICIEQSVFLNVYIIKEKESVCLGDLEILF